MDIPRKEKILGEEVLITEELIRDAQLAHDLYEKALHTDTSQLTSLYNIDTFRQVLFGDT